MKQRAIELYAYSLLAGSGDATDQTCRAYFIGRIGAEKACCGAYCLALIWLPLHNPPEGKQMALTWGSLFAGGMVAFVLPAAVLWLNTRKRNAGWWMLFALAVFVIVGNVAASA
jgi:hypothetical protein